ncbi:hypothetical protein [Gilvimarinus sp. DA14]|uniref:hypothetical protein n=1 Tax=Gilvimarinus sp. DA14 TaxID=2956798 RepID=UPI0020B783BE|nr:hypothetical protein [Gilvimarinus sp. DA14]UTF60451.1 hypothetical protein NHM04_01255 [Gilvimarinus sp. DA14]
MRFNTKLLIGAVVFLLLVFVSFKVVLKSTNQEYPAKWQNTVVNPVARTPAADPSKSEKTETASGLSSEASQARGYHGGETFEDWLVQYLANSARPNEMLALMLMRIPDSSEEVARLRELINQTSEKALALCLLAQSSVEDAPVITSQELEMLKSLAPDNAVVDDILAEHAYRSGDFSQALEHFQNAGNAPSNNAYQAKYIEMIGDVYLDRYGYLTGDEFTDILGVSAAQTVPGLRFVHQVCYANALDAAWHSACAKRADVLFRQGETLVERAVGAGLALDFDDTNAARYSEQIQRDQLEFMELSEALNEKITVSGGMINRELWQEYIALYEQERQLAALRFLVKRL